MTKKEALTRKLESLEKQENNIHYSIEYLDHDYKKVYEEISFELNKKLNNVENREDRYKKILKNISKQKEDIKSELKQLAVGMKAKEKNKVDKFGG